MKILLVQFAGRGGSQLYTAQLANALAKNHDVFVLLANHLWDDKYYNKNVKKICISAPPDYIKMFLLTLNPLTYLKIIKIVNEINPDVIHATQDFPWTTLVLPFIKHYPVVVTDHDPCFHKGTKIDMKLYLGFSKLFMRKKSRAIIVHGKRLKSMLIRKGIPENKIFVLPHGNFSFYTKWKKEKIKEFKSVLFFGSISKYKGIEYLIEAEPFISSKIPDFKIVIAGSGDFKKYLNLIKNDEKFQIHNRFIPDEEVAELFQKSSIVVLPYIDASQTGIIPIAYSFKKPVVATDVGSIPEVVDNTKTGYVVAPENSEELADAIIKLLTDDDLRKNMGENAYKKSTVELSWDRIADATTEIYKKFVSMYDDLKNN